MQLRTILTLLSPTATPKLSPWLSLPVNGVRQPRTACRHQKTSAWNGGSRNSLRVFGLPRKRLCRWSWRVGEPKFLVDVWQISRSYTWVSCDRRWHAWIDHDILLWHAGRSSTLDPKVYWDQTERLWVNECIVDIATTYDMVLLANQFPPFQILQPSSSEIRKDGLDLCRREIRSWFRLEYDGETQMPDCLNLDFLR